MEIDALMKALEGYYGAYPEGRSVREFVRRYILSDIQEKNYDKLLKFITYSHPARFGAPGVSDIEEAIDKARKQGKGSDVHKPPAFSLEEIEITDEEHKKGIKIMSQNGGLKGMVDSLVKDKSVRRENERKSNL